MSAPVKPGDMLLGKYRVERVLGQGGMGVVVAVRHVELGELFAIKFLLPAALAQPDAVERFLREARACVRLKGEHVVKVQDVGRLPDGLPYMVMEHLTGHDLKAFVKQRGPLPVAEAITYLSQACEAVAEAHSLGIVHRDLKPANMFLIQRRNGAPCVKVLDFGISKATEPEKAEQHALTQTGVVLGSPIYMSPEQMLRTKEADPRSDIWSLGVVFYQLLTGTVPFLAEALTEIIGKVLQEEPLPPSRHRPEIPPAIDAIVMTCLQKRRENRYQTVEQLLSALHDACAAAPLQAPFAATPVAGGRPPLPSQPELSGGRLPLPSQPELSGGRPPLPSQPGPVAQTGQAWGATSTRAAQVGAPKRTGLMVFAAVVAVTLLGGGIFAVLQLRGSSDVATGAAKEAVTAAPPVTPSVTAAASSDIRPAPASAAPIATASSVVSAISSPAPAASTTAKAGAGTPAKPAGKAATSAAPTVKKHDSMF